MPAFLNDVTKKVNATLDDRYSLTDREIALVAEAVRLTIETIGLGIANDGEIYNPAPAPSTAVQPQRHVRWSGGRRRR